MLFLTNELAKKAEITIFASKVKARTGLQAVASWVGRKEYIKGRFARIRYHGLGINPQLRAWFSSFFLVFGCFTALSTGLPL